MSIISRNAARHAMACRVGYFAVLGNACHAVPCTFACLKRVPCRSMLGYPFKEFNSSLFVSNLMPKWSQNDAKVDPKRCQSGPKMMSKWSQNECIELYHCPFSTQNSWTRNPWCAFGPEATGVWVSDLQRSLVGLLFVWSVPNSTNKFNCVYNVFLLSLLHNSFF